MFEVARNEVNFNRSFVNGKVKTFLKQLLQILWITFLTQLFSPIDIHKY